MLTFEHKLEPCGYCGQFDDLDIDWVKYPTDNPFYITCPICRQHGPYSGTIKDAFDNWNEEQAKITKRTAEEFANSN